MRTLISFSFLFICNLAFGNKIDDLKTPEDVLKFIKRNFDKQERFHIKIEKTNAIDFKFMQLDINKDGLTDLLINGIYLYAIIDKGGQDDFEEQYIGGRHFNCQLLAIDTTSKLPLFIVQKDNDYDNETDREIVFKPDTLINLYGGFIEYNPSPKPIQFEQIKIMTSRCFGTCPIFEMTINKARKAILNAKEYNNLNGIYKSKVDETTFSNLVGLLSYLNLDSLKNSYAIGVTDNPSIDLVIEANNSVKKIHDYGLEGTFGLKRLYSILYKLKHTQNW